MSHQQMNEEILRPVGGNARALLENGRRWGAEAKLHMSENELRILHHLERYEFAAETINAESREGSYLLDIGAGDGTGLSVIHELCRPVPALHAIEIDAVACERMRRLLPTAEVVNASVGEFDFRRRYDYTLLYETLGHQHIVSDLALLKKVETRVLLLSIPYYRHYAKKFYFYRLYDPVSILELLERAVPNQRIEMFGQFHPVNRENDSDRQILPIGKLAREPDFIICRIGSV
jgi:hypothetical protein